MCAHEEHVPCSGLPDPLVLHQVAQQVLQARDECLAAEGGGAVLRCLQRCLLHALLPPRWLSDAFAQRHARVTEAEVGSWDEAFGAPWPPGTRLATVRKHKRLKQAIHAEAWTRVLAGAPVTRDLFEQIGEQRGICVSGSLAEKLYHEALQEGMPNPVAVRAARAGRHESHVSDEMSGTVFVDACATLTPLQQRGAP
jgi:hypothetical protein